MAAVLSSTKLKKANIIPASSYLVTITASFQELQKKQNLLQLLFNIQGYSVDLIPFVF